MAARTTLIQPDRTPLRLDAACVAHLGMTPDETIVLEPALSDPTAEAPAHLLADLRRRLDEIERDETYASVRREFIGAEEASTYALSHTTRARSALLDGLEGQSAAPSEVLAAALLLADRSGALGAGLTRVGCHPDRFGRCPVPSIAKTQHRMDASSPARRTCSLSEHSDHREATPSPNTPTSATIFPLGSREHKA